MFRKITAAVVLTALAFSLNASSGETQPVQYTNVVIVDDDGNPVDQADEPVGMAMVEQKPEFPGGDAAMYQWMAQNMVYPPQAAEEGIQGRVVVRFVITKTGDISKVEVVRSRHEALDKEAVRLIKAMPKWEPGLMDGKPVSVTYILPVTFKLSN